MNLSLETGSIIILAMNTFVLFLFIIPFNPT